jgi:hypothetical protein
VFLIPVLFVMVSKIFGTARAAAPSPAPGVTHGAKA